MLLAGSTQSGLAREMFNLWREPNNGACRTAGHFEDIQGWHVHV